MKGGHEVARLSQRPMERVVSFSARNTEPGLVRITHGDRAAFLAEIETALRARQGFTVATLNVDHLVKLQQTPAFLEAYCQHSHVVADGRPVVWLSRLAGQRVDLIPGSEMVAALAARAARAKAPVALLGSTEEVLQKAAQILEARHEGLKVVCALSPPFGFDPNDAVVPQIAQQIEESGAALCFLALGAPKQEILAARLATMVPRCGFISVGAGLDFVAGHQKRAPAWVQRIAMEWFWRMAGSPRRLLGRYAACFAIMPHMIAQARRDRRL
ncbi:MAG: WecB/TagA/CpsF family glycosyltransferase [Pseudomonadota bacterium]